MPPRAALNSATVITDAISFSFRLGDPPGTGV